MQCRDALTASRTPPLYPEIAGWLPVKRAAPDASAPGSQSVTNRIPRDRGAPHCPPGPWRGWLSTPTRKRWSARYGPRSPRWSGPGQHPGTLAALRFVLIHHQPPTRNGCCPTCRRQSWRHLWRRRRFPCVIWRQIRGELLGHLTIAGTPPLSTEHIIAQLEQLRELLPAPVGQSHD